MSLEEYKQRVAVSKLKKSDKQWFPRWLHRYGSTVPLSGSLLPVTLDHVIRFSRSLRDHGTPAWQRLQAVRAVEAYRDFVLETQEPSLACINRGHPLCKQNATSHRCYPAIAGSFMKK